MKSASLETVNLKLPSDKSISHRLILAALLNVGEYKLVGLTVSKDIQASIDAVKSLGAKVKSLGDDQFIIIPASESPSRDVVIDCQNSGTTARLLLGIIAGKKIPVSVTLTGDSSLCLRPMKRVTQTLEIAGQVFNHGDYLPIKINPSIEIQPIIFELPIASAQVKSAFLYAGLQSKGMSTLTGLINSRDHTETLFKAAGVKLEVNKNEIQINGPQNLKLTGEYQIPRDPSAVAFWCLYSILSKNKNTSFSHVLLNPSRLGFFEMIEKMGCHIERKESGQFYEACGDICLELPSAGLRSTDISTEMIPKLIDEIPILCVLMALADGVSTISSVSELKFKESNRLEASKTIAKAFGAEVLEEDDNLIIHPGKYEKTYDFGRLLDSRDHRIIMILAIISKAYDIPLELKHPEDVEVSYPCFWEVLEQLS